MTSEHRLRENFVFFSDIAHSQKTHCARRFGKSWRFHLKLSNVQWIIYIGDSTLENGTTTLAKLHDCESLKSRMAWGWLRTKFWEQYVRDDGEIIGVASISVIVISGFLKEWRMRGVLRAGPWQQWWNHIEY